MNDEKVTDPRIAVAAAAWTNFVRRGGQWNFQARGPLVLEVYRHRKFAFQAQGAVPSNAAMETITVKEVPDPSDPERRLLALMDGTIVR